MFAGDTFPDDLEEEEYSYVDPNSSKSPAYWAKRAEAAAERKRLDASLKHQANQERERFSQKEAKMPEARLCCWSVSIPDCYAAPEVRGNPTCTGTLVQDYGRFSEGDKIQSSAIVKVEGRRVTTKSGSVYILEGSPHPGWIEHMERERVEVDLANPLKHWELG